MANPDVANILKSGAICWYAAAGVAFPDETSVDAGAAWGGTWAKLGFTKEPVKLAYEDEEHEIEVEEVLMAIGRKKIGESAMIETVLAEVTADYLQLGLGGTVTTTAAGAGQKGFEQLLAGENSEKTIYTIGFEGIRYNSTGVPLPIRFGFYRCTFRLNGELLFSRRSDDYTGVPLQVKALSPTDGSKPIWMQRITAPAT
jgi:hypothetical protein